MPNNKKSFLMYNDLCEIFKELSDEEAGKLIKAICFSDYKPDKLTKLLLHPFKTVLERDNHKYTAICERNKKNIHKRWAEKHTKNTTGKSGIPKHTKNTDSDSDSDSDINKKKKTKKEKGYDMCFEKFWETKPERAGANSKKEAYSCWNARIKEGCTSREMTNGVIKYRDFCKLTGKLNTEFVMQMTRFLGTAKYFKEKWEVHKNGQTTKQKLDEASERIIKKYT